MSEEVKEYERFINQETGEFFDIYDGDRLVITRHNQKEAIQKSLHTKQLNKELKQWGDELGGFVFVLFKYCNNLLEQHQEIIPEDITKLFYLATYVDYNGTLIYDNHCMTRSEMQKLLKMSREKFGQFFNKMKKIGIFSQNTNKNININKEYFSKGEIDKEIKKYYNYTKVYINTIRYLYEHVPQRNQGQLGKYFKMIPYIHRQQNVLSWNPEGLINEIKFMTLKELKEILGYHKNSVKGFMNELLETRLENGEAIVGFFITNVDFWKSVVIINPKVIYGGNFDLPEGKDSIIKWFSK